MTPLLQWANRHGISQAALTDLLYTLGLTAAGSAGAVSGLTSEAGVQQQVRLVVTRAGGRVWRNNSGVTQDERGNVVRYGLSNESTQVNKVCKSSDLIGIRPVRCECGRGPYGLFLALEVKRPGWVFAGDRNCSCKRGRLCQSCHERAQLNFLKLVTSLGGIGKFVTDPGQV